MKIYLILLILFLPFIVNAQQNSNHDLKYNKSRPLLYTLRIEETNTLDEKGIPNFSDSIKGQNGSIFYPKSKLDIFEVSMTPFGKDSINLIMESRKERFNKNLPDSIVLFNKSIGQNIFLSAVVNDIGETLSFYRTSYTKDLISLLFALPEFAVSKGDVYKIPTNLIQLGTEFVISNAQQNNIAIISDIINLNDSVVAIIEFDLHERVEGHLYKFNNSSQEIRYLDVSYKSKGYFDVKSGNWLKMEGELKKETNFPIFLSNTSKKYNLVLEK